MSDLLSLKELQELQSLKDIASNSENYIDVNKLESDFLLFSGLVPNKKLTVKVPKLFRLKGHKIQSFEKVLDLLKLPYDKDKLNFIDFSGSYSVDSPNNLLIFSSQNQHRADQYSSSRSHLLPLVRDIYLHYSKLLSDYTVHEAIFGQVKIKRGNLNLDDLSIYPNRFANGQYKLSVELHTSNNTLDKICELDKLGKELKRNPEKNISDPKFLKKIVDLSTNLREVIGPPARYSVPKKKSIESNVNSCIVDYHGTKVYFLYEPQTNENVAVYFGRDIFNSGRPRNLIVLNGEEYQDTLSRLLSLEMFKYSKNILNKKITVMRRMRDKAMRVSDDGKIDETYVNFLDSLESAESELSKIKNQSYLKKRLLSVEPELVEFMIYPAKEDPVVHELMNKLSWNSSLRRYHNTSLFISDFENADDEEKKYMLNEVQSNLLFNNQQNNDVNLWLYSTHHDFCDENKIKFNLINDDK